MTNTVLLESKIKDFGFTIKDVSVKLGISRAGFYKKLNNSTEFKASEISKLSEMLCLSGKEKEQIFFATCVDVKSTQM